MFSKGSDQKHQQGFGLIEVIVSVGLMAIVAAGISSLMTNQLKAQRTVELRGDRSAMIRQLSLSTSCQATLGGNPAAACAGGTIALNGMTTSGTVFPLLPAAGKKVGAWTYQARCTPGNTINVRAVRVRAGASINSSNAGDYLPDPLTNKVSYLPNDPATQLYPGGGELCAGGGTLKTASGSLSFGPNGVNLGGRPKTILFHVAVAFPLFPPVPFSCFYDVSTFTNTTMHCTDPGSDPFNLLQVYINPTGFDLGGGFRTAIRNPLVGHGGPDIVYFATYYGQ
ncbi:MAG: prepilin-type N-terminal cleavage/methylation domain-containing protein [Proteobacteria bacterium]|nr:prepilin-type N-terminal cleavage/methylation domain-containing protein [Pseudomonadota bacterium]